MSSAGDRATAEEPIDLRDDRGVDEPALRTQEQIVGAVDTPGDRSANFRGSGRGARVPGSGATDGCAVGGRAEDRPSGCDPAANCRARGDSRCDT